MAAAEARAVWQRITVNRCFVQEDAKRAPKLACCQASSSSSSASTKQVDTESVGAVDLQEQSSGAFMPLNRNPRFPDLSPDTRWWIHMQSSYANQKELMHDQMKPWEAEVDVPGEGSVKDNCEYMGEYVEMMTETKESSDFVGFGFSNELYFGMSPWNLSDEKAGHWWRTTNTDELASFIGQRSVDCIENCDLPMPQRIHSSKRSYGSPRSCVRDGSSQAGCLPNRARDRHEQYGCEKSFSRSTSLKDRTETQSHDSSESGLSKAELLEALRHSQTRAREAEKAAKEAYMEKEHHIKLLFKQASQLFAYKQWFQLLHLEALYLQIKKNNNNGHYDSPILDLPWTPWEARKWRRRILQKNERVRRANAKADITKYGVGLAVGLSLVSAGLLLGWTVGWMLPF